MSRFGAIPAEENSTPIATNRFGGVLVEDEGLIDRQSVINDIRSPENLKPLFPTPPDQDQMQVIN